MTITFEDGRVRLESIVVDYLDDRKGLCKRSIHRNK